MVRKSRFRERESEYSLQPYQSVSESINYMIRSVL